MITKQQLTQAEQEHWRHTVDTVNTWAKEHVPTQYSYNAPYVYWRSALVAGVIDQSMYDYAQTKYGNLWNYVGD